MVASRNVVFLKNSWDTGPENPFKHKLRKSSQRSLSLRTRKDRMSVDGVPCLLTRKDRMTIYGVLCFLTLALAPASLFVFGPSTFAIAKSGTENSLPANITEHQNFLPEWIRPIIEDELPWPPALLTKWFGTLSLRRKTHQSNNARWNASGTPLGVSFEGEWPEVQCKSDSLHHFAGERRLKHHLYRAGRVDTMYEHPIPKVIHQTFGRKRPGGFEQLSMGQWLLQHPFYEHVIWSDTSAREFVAECVPSVLGLYDEAPVGVMRSDMLRYLLLLVFGGVWGDADTQPLRPFDDWLRGVEGSPELDDVTLIAGVEADREDWREASYVRRVQIVQWTMAAAPHHPVVRFVVQRMLRNVAALANQLSGASNSLLPDLRPSSLLGKHPGHTRNSLLPDLSPSQEGGHSLLGKHPGHTSFSSSDEPTSSLTTSALKSRIITRPMSKEDVLLATGPGAWTDAISWGLEKRGSSILNLTGLRKGRLVGGDLVVLPITAFSPGIGLGSGPEDDPEARVKHWFVGSWKSQLDHGNLEVNGGG